MTDMTDRGRKRDEEKPKEKKKVALADISNSPKKDNRPRGILNYERKTHWYTNTICWTKHSFHGCNSTINLFGAKSIAKHFKRRNDTLAFEEEIRGADQKS